MSLKRLVITLVLPFALKAQLTLSYYPFNNQLSLATNVLRPVWADLRVETNTYVSNLNMELSPMINLRRRAIYTVYLGPGIAFNPVTAAYYGYFLQGVFVDVGTRVMPFEKARALQLIFEISPYVNDRLRGGNLRARLGVGYTFGKGSAASKDEPAGK